MSNGLSALPATLDDLAQAINAEHEQAQEAMQSSLAHALRCGELLNQAKAQLNHGEWLPWLTANCEFSDRTARAYMRVARNQAELGKSATIANLTFSDALGLLAEPKTEPEEKPALDWFPALEIHELGMLFPWMQNKELDGLALSIKQVGLLNPITLYEGRILDGKCRYEACRRAGVMPKFRIFEGDRKAAFDYVWSYNAIRAHYTPDQRAVALFRLQELQKDKDTFEPVIEALREIRDSKLYRGTHGTFEGYCAERWGLTGDLLELYGL